MVSEILTSILVVIGYGILGGLVSGYVFKRIAKLLVVFIALLLLASNYFGYIGPLGTLKVALTNYFMEQTDIGGTLLAGILINIPFTIGFLIGFIIGIKKF